MGPLTTPKKGREVGSVDPWTPTSNLKMLISAASPDIRNREKELCNDGREGVDSTQVQKVLALTHDRHFPISQSVHRNKFLTRCALLSSCRTPRTEKNPKNWSAGKRKVWVCSAINSSPVTQITRTLRSTMTSAWMMWPLSSVCLLYPLFVVFFLTKSVIQHPSIFSQSVSDIRAAANGGFTPKLCFCFIAQLI